MILLVRPWSIDGTSDQVLGPADCFLLELDTEGDGKLERVPYASLLVHGSKELRLLPYPVSGSSSESPMVNGLPVKPQTGQQARTPAESIAEDALTWMHAVLARIEDLRSALDDPEYLWDQLADSWHKAQDESQAFMAEIVRQARDMPSQLGVLRNRIRRILRRSRERVPVSRAQEIDRHSMIWFARQPGRTIAERAGPGQRVLAVARHESFDTPENRVLHSYLRLAHLVSRQWMLEHIQAKSGEHYRAVEGYGRHCRRFQRELETLGVGLAEAGTTPNYVLTEDRAYRGVREAWLRLLRQEFVEDNLWSWQANSWCDFCVLLLTLSLYEMDGSELIAQAPIVWSDETSMGRKFTHDTPFAVFWLKPENVIIEVQSRPTSASLLQMECRAWVWLRITRLSTGMAPCFVPVWTPHAFERLDGHVSALEATRMIEKVGRGGAIRQGLILFPAKGESGAVSCERGNIRVVAIPLDGSGHSLQDGMSDVGNYLRTFLERIT